MKSQRSRKQRYQLRLSWSMLAFCAIGWPLSSVTIAKDEPFVILSLSWLALVYAAVTALLVADGNS